MGWCSHCDCEPPTIRDPEKGYICCQLCGRILDQDMYFTGPTFVKDSSGQSRASGSVMHSVQSGYNASRERTLDKGRDEINYILDGLQISGGLSMTNLAFKFYGIAVDRNFTKGRRTTHVAASCVYIACRQTKKAYLLIDFSDFLQVNVYVLGAVFLQLCKTLCLSETPIVQKLVDPSLFMWRFTERLLKKKDKDVADTAIRIVASMKRDWMQTGRKPSGVCGAALYISTLAHGLKFPKSEIIRVVHICEATLTKRLIEFENTESGSLTLEEFNARANELDEEPQLKKMPTPGEVLCKHKDKNPPHFAHGLCQKCYKKFIEISGGLDGGAEPPAFQHAERQRIEKEKHEKKTKQHDFDKDKSISDSVSPGNDKGESGVSKDSVKAGHQTADASVGNEEVEAGSMGDDDSEGLSDIDDLEVDGYIHNEEEKELRRIIWEEMNKEYLEEQAIKEAAAAAARKSYEASFANGSQDVLAAKELAEATAAAVAKSKKERRQRRADEAKNLTPAKTPFEATHRMLKRKGLSSKINYEALGALYTNENENSKKKKLEDPIDEPDGLPIDEEAQDADQGNVSDIEMATTYNDQNLEYDYYDGEGDGDGDYRNDYDFYEDD